MGKFSTEDVRSTRSIAAARLVAGIFDMQEMGFEQNGQAKR